MLTFMVVVVVAAWVVVVVAAGVVVVGGLSLQGLRYLLSGDSLSNNALSVIIFDIIYIKFGLRSCIEIKSSAWNTSIEILYYLNKLLIE